MMIYVTNTYGEEIYFDGAVQHMDDELREELCSQLAPCTEQELFDAYCAAHKERFGEEFALNEQNPVW